MFGKGFRSRIAVIGPSLLLLEDMSRTMQQISKVHVSLGGSPKIQHDCRYARKGCDSCEKKHENAFLTSSTWPRMSITLQKLFIFES